MSLWAVISQALRITVANGGCYVSARIIRLFELLQKWIQAALAA